SSVRRRPRGAGSAPRGAGTPWPNGKSNCRWRDRARVRDREMELSPKGKNNRRLTSPDQVAFRIDFPRWLAGLAARDRHAVQDLALGHRTEVVARKYGVTPGAVSHRRRDFHRAWQRFQGELSGSEDATAPATVTMSR